MSKVVVKILIAGRTVVIGGIERDDEKLAKLLALSTDTTVSLTVSSTPETASLVGQLQYCIGTEVPIPKPSVFELTEERVTALSMTTREYLRTHAQGEKAAVTRLINVLSDYVDRINVEARHMNEPEIDQLEYIWQVCEKTEAILYRERRLGPKGIGLLEMALQQRGLRLGLKNELAKVKDSLPQFTP